MRKPRPTLRVRRSALPPGLVRCKRWCCGRGGGSAPWQPQSFVMRRIGPPRSPHVACPPLSSTLFLAGRQTSMDPQRAVAFSTAHAGGCGGEQYVDSCIRTRFSSRNGAVHCHRKRCHGAGLRPSAARNITSLWFAHFVPGLQRWAHALVSKSSHTEHSPVDQSLPPDIAANAPARSQCSSSPATS